MEYRRCTSPAVLWGWGLFLEISPVILRNGSRARNNSCNLSTACGSRPPDKQLHVASLCHDSATKSPSAAARNIAQQNPVAWRDPDSAEWPLRERVSQHLWELPPHGLEGLTQNVGDAGALTPGLGQILLLMGETGAQMGCGMSACFTVRTHRDTGSAKELFISELAHRVC